MVFKRFFSKEYAELDNLKKEYENELVKLKRKVSEYDTTILLNQNMKLMEENKRLKELLKVYEKVSSRQDDGRFNVWEIPPVTCGTRTKTTTELKQENKE